MNKMNIVIISDSSGGTAFCDAKTTLSQFPKVTTIFKRFPFVKSEDDLNVALKYAKNNDGAIFDTLVSPKLNERTYNYAKWNHLVLVDCLHQPVSAIKNHYHIRPVLQTGMVHRLTSEYFDRVNAISFTIHNDDGRFPQNIPKADIVILGPSRTSKTPLSQYLAQRYGLKVINVPVGPVTQLPAQVKSVDSKHLFGLTSSVKMLQKFRISRAKNMGIPTNTPYTDPQHIAKELNYVKKLYQSLHCKVIDVSNKSIEETSVFILQSMGLTEMQ